MRIWLVQVTPVAEFTKEKSVENFGIQVCRTQLQVMHKFFWLFLWLFTVTYNITDLMTFSLSFPESFEKISRRYRETFE